MADFKTHITVSTAVGVGYGAVAHTQFGIPWPTCVMAGTLCSVSGMLPDLDSDSGVPLRESLSFAAACVPMLCLERFRHLGWPPETIALAGAGLYLAIRFGVGKMLKKYTVHRGMFHSIPAAIIAGECAFLICSYGDIYIRSYKACAVLVGFLSHLILDEIWSVKLKGGIGLKSSSGTAMKLWGDDAWANLSCYGKMILLAVVVLNDPIWTTVSPQGEELHTIASRIFGEAKKVVPQNLAENLENRLAERLTISGGGTNSQPTPSYPAQPQYDAPQAFAAQSQYGSPQYGQPQNAQPQYTPQYSTPAYAPTPPYSAPRDYSNPYAGAPAFNAAPMPAPYLPPASPPTYTPPAQPAPYYYAPQSGQTYPYTPPQRY